MWSIIRPTVLLLYLDPVELLTFASWNPVPSFRLGNRSLFANSSVWEVHICDQKLKFITIFGTPRDYPR
ncbi:hypothetical protein AYI70_g8473 [Smittium culicis]|uniref:Uncharacterized protein n=1 Tax=Smittium culicis TaxID=133412 RepID=A0A1R1XFR8_9FUNG|nr:hypothetical protein AYI70_g8473 [Smittium culicis]